MKMNSRAGADDKDRAAQELAVTLNAFVRRRAEALLPLPADEREAHYAAVHAAATHLAIEHGRPEREASAWALKIVLLTRVMVRALEEQASPGRLASRLRVVMERDRAEMERDHGSLRLHPPNS